MHKHSGQKEEVVEWIKKTLSDYMLVYKRKNTFLFKDSERMKKVKGWQIVTNKKWSDYTNMRKNRFQDKNCYSIQRSVFYNDKRANLSGKYNNYEYICT